MSDVINLTITEKIDKFSLAMTEENPIQVSFLNTALPDPSVAQAKLDAQTAQAAAEAALLAAEEAKALAETAAQSAQESVDSIDEVVQGVVDTSVNEAKVELESNAIINALIFG